MSHKLRKLSLRNSLPLIQRKTTFKITSELSIGNRDELSDILQRKLGDDAFKMQKNSVLLSKDRKTALFDTEFEIEKQVLVSTIFKWFSNVLEYILSPCPHFPPLSVNAQ